MAKMKLVLMTAICMAVAACGGGSGSASGSAVGASSADSGPVGEASSVVNGLDHTPPTDGGFQVFGDLKDFAGAGLVLVMNGKEYTVERNMKEFKFFESIQPGHTYELAIKKQPYAPTQQCSIVGNGSGTASDHMPQIDIQCEAAVKHVYSSSTVSNSISGYRWNNGVDVLMSPVAMDNLNSYNFASEGAGLAKHPSNSVVYSISPRLLSARTVDEDNVPLSDMSTILYDWTNLFGQDVIVQPEGKKIYVMLGAMLVSYDLDAKGSIISSTKKATDFSASLGQVAGIALNLGGLKNTRSGIYLWSNAGKMMLAPLDSNGVVGTPVDLGQKVLKMSKLVFHPNGKFAYSANDDLDSVSVFDVDSMGILELKETPPLANGISTKDIAIDANGQTLFVAAVSASGPVKTIYTRVNINPNGSIMKDSSFQQDGVQGRIAAVHPISSDLYITGGGNAWLVSSGRDVSWVAAALKPLPSNEKQAAILLY